MSNIQSRDERERQDEIAYYAWKAADIASSYHGVSQGDAASRHAHKLQDDTARHAKSAGRNRTREKTKPVPTGAGGIGHFIVFAGSMAACVMFAGAAAGILGLTVSENGEEAILWGSFAISGIVTLIVHFKTTPGAWKEANKPINLNGPPRARRGNQRGTP